ncbi:MAG: hypothetical protein V4538_07960 [Bacteroidota bacterium]
MKEDILEQLIDGYFLRQVATFTKHNVKYRPDQSSIKKEEKNKYSVHSDIDILSVNLQKKTTNVVTCKSWQGGFNVEKHLHWLSDPEKHSTKVSGREVWKSFRELTDPIWSKAFRNKIFEETKQKQFNYIIAVTKLNNSRYVNDFCNNQLFLDSLSGEEGFKVKIEFLTLETIITTIQNDPSNTAVESTEIGRFLQLLKAADLKFERKTSS